MAPLGHNPNSSNTLESTGSKKMQKSNKSKKHLKKNNLILTGDSFKSRLLNNRNDNYKSLHKKKESFDDTLDVMNSTGHFEFLLRKNIYNYFFLRKQNKLDNLLKIKIDSYNIVKKSKFSNGQISDILISNDIFTEIINDVVNLYVKQGIKSDSSVSLNL